MAYSRNPKEKIVRFHRYRIRNKWHHSDEDIWPWLVNQSSGLYITFRRIIKALQNKYGNTDLKYVPDLFGGSTKTIIKEIPYPIKRTKPSQTIYSGVDKIPIQQSAPQDEYNPQVRGNRSYHHNHHKDKTIAKRRKRPIRSRPAPKPKKKSFSDNKSSSSSNDGLLSGSELKNILNIKH